MLLSLSDILTTQMAAQTISAPAASNVPANNSASFQSYLDNQQVNIPTKNNFNANVSVVSKPDIHSVNAIYKANEVSASNATGQVNRNASAAANDTNQNNTINVTSVSQNNQVNNQPSTQNIISKVQDLSPDQRAQVVDLYNELKNGTNLSADNIQKLQNILPSLFGNAIPDGLTVQQIASQIASQNGTQQNSAMQVGDTQNLVLTTPVFAGTPAPELPAQPSLTANDLLNVLAQLQAGAANLSSGNENQTTVNSNTVSQQLQTDISKLSNSDLQTLQQVLTKLALNGIPAGISATDVISQVVSQIKTADASAGVNAAPANNIDDILSKMNFAATAKNQNAAKTATALAKQPEGIDISKLASSIIDAAKKEASKPQITASTIKAQVSDISNTDKNNKDNQSQTVNVFSGVDLSSIQTPVNTPLPTDVPQPIQNEPIAAQSTTEHKNLTTLPALANNVNVNPNAAANTPADIANTTQTFNPLNVTGIDAIKQVVSQSIPTKDDIATAGSIDGTIANPISGMSSENFVKFQSMLTDTQSPTNTTSTNKNTPGSPEDVMAQIKFGMTTGGGSNNTSNISIQLHPKELGKVDISMQVGNDGKTHVMVMAEKTDTLNMLQKESSSLKGMLTDALKTDSGNLNFSFQQSGSDAWKQQFANNQFGRANGIGRDINGISGDYLTAQSYAYNMIATQGLDIRV